MSDERSIGIAQAAQQQGPLSKDTRTLLLYDANRKSAVIAYILWFFLGWFGAHNFYLGRKGVGIAQVLLTISVIGWSSRSSGSWWMHFSFPAGCAGKIISC